MSIVNFDELVIAGLVERLSEIFPEKNQEEIDSMVNFRLAHYASMIVDTLVQDFNSCDCDD